MKLNLHPLLIALFLGFITLSAHAQTKEGIPPSDRLPPILPGQQVGNQVIITTAGAVVGESDRLPSVPETARVDTLPPGLIVDTRRDFTDAANTAGQAAIQIQRAPGEHAPDSASSTKIESED